MKKPILTEAETDIVKEAKKILKKLAKKHMKLEEKSLSLATAKARLDELEDEVYRVGIDFNADGIAFISY